MNQVFKLVISDTIGPSSKPTVVSAHVTILRGAYMVGPICQTHISSSLFFLSPHNPATTRRPGTPPPGRHSPCPRRPRPAALLHYACSPPEGLLPSAPPGHPGLPLSHGGLQQSTEPRSLGVRGLRLGLCEWRRRRPRAMGNGEPAREPRHRSDKPAREAAPAIAAASRGPHHRFEKAAGRQGRPCQPSLPGRGGRATAPTRRLAGEGGRVRRRCCAERGAREETRRAGPRHSSVMPSTLLREGVELPMLRWPSGVRTAAAPPGSRRAHCGNDGSDVERG